MCTILENLDPSEVREAFMNGTVDSSSVDLTEIATLLRIAVLKNDTEYASAIVDGVPNVLNHDDGGGKILWHTLENGNETLARKFILAGVDLNYRSRNGSTLLHRFMTEYPKIAELMITNGADINITDCSQNTVLYVAVREGLKNIVIAISKMGIMFKNESRILGLAARKRNAAELLPILIRSSSITTKKDRAKKAFHSYMKVILASDHKTYDLHFIQNLIDLALQPNYTGHEVVALLQNAVTSKYLADVVRLLLNYVKSLNGKYEEVATLLCHAAKHPKSTVSAYLIEKGAHVNARTKDYDYPLHIACHYGSIQNIHLLLSLGADLNFLNARGHTPFGNMASEPFNDNHKIVIRHLAIMNSKGLLIHPNDKARIEQNHSMNVYYEECKNELWNMKQTKIFENITFYCFIDRSSEELCELVRHVDFLKNYYLNQREGLIKFKNYCMHIHIKLKMAVERKNITLARAKLFEEACTTDYPPYVRITRDIMNEEPNLKNFEHNFYIRLHQLINDPSELGHPLCLLN